MAKSSKSTTKRSPRKGAAKTSAPKTVKSGTGKRAGSKSATTKRKPESGARKTTSRTRQALRLIFSYDGDKVKLVSKRPVRMTVPPSDSLEGYEDHKGFWAELRNAKKKTLYRQVLHNPTKNDAEIFSGEGITRMPAPNRTGTFTVLVPDTVEGHEVTLSRSAGVPVTREGIPMYGLTAMTRPLATGPAVQFKSIKLKK